MHMHERCHLQGDESRKKKGKDLSGLSLSLYRTEYMQVVSFALLSANNSSMYSAQSTPYGAHTPTSTGENLDEARLKSTLRKTLWVSTSYCQPCVNLSYQNAYRIRHRVQSTTNQYVVLW